MNVQEHTERYDVSLATVKGVFSETHNAGVAYLGACHPSPSSADDNFESLHGRPGDRPVDPILPQECGDCCPNISICEQCLRLAEVCNCSLPTMETCWSKSCPSSSCVKWDCACTCQPPECDSCNCLCFEIRIK